MLISKIIKSLQEIIDEYGDIEGRVLSKGFFEGMLNRSFDNDDDINFGITCLPDFEKISELPEKEKMQFNVFDGRDEKVPRKANHVEIVGERFDASLFILEHETDKSKPVFKVVAYSHREANDLFRKYYLDNKEKLKGTVLDFEIEKDDLPILKFTFQACGYNGMSGYKLKEIKFGEVIENEPRD